MEKRYNAIRYFAYALEIVIFYVAMGMPKLLPEIFGSKPCLLVAAALTIALFERETCAMIFGAVAGAFTDFGYSNSLGFFTIMLAAICFFVSYSSRNYVVVNIVNSAIAVLVIIGALMCLHFMIFHASRGYDGYGGYFLEHYLSRIFYTFLFFFPFFYLNRMLSQNIKAAEL